LRVSMEDFKNRLLMYVESYLGASQREFEDECGLTHGSISKIKVKGPSVDNLAKISTTHPELNLNWLVSGTGDMIIKAPVQSINGNGNHHNVNGSDEKYVAHLETEVEALRKEKTELMQMVQKLLK